MQMKLRTTIQGCLEPLAKAATAVMVHVVDHHTTFEFLCPCDGRERVTRQVLVTDGTLSGHVVGKQDRSRSFAKIEHAATWLSAGKPVLRGDLDEVDHRAAAGEAEAAFRLDEMHLSGQFDPSEFATCMLLKSHAACDWGMYGEDAIEHRLDFWDNEADDLLARWPDLKPGDRGTAHVIYCRLAETIDREFRERAERRAA